MDRREKLIAAAVDTYELHSDNAGISRRGDDLTGPAFPGLPELMSAAGHGDADDLRRFIDEHEAEIWHQLGDNWEAMNKLRREQRD
jgi:hypothetical protein